jgi:DNA-nicking Smr family endonuclease
MKRSSTRIPELPAAPRRKRSLSEEERAIWESVAGQTRPLRNKPRVPKAQADADAVDAPAMANPTAAPMKAPASGKRSPPPEPPRLAPLARRERTQLSRGKKQIDARLDLHGMTQTRAHRELSGFLQRSHGAGFTFVLVITGKGKIGTESERGVLRRQVPQWLALPEFRSLVVGFEQAHIGHGGEGALYVRIRRARL